MSVIYFSRSNETFLDFYEKLRCRQEEVIAGNKYDRMCGVHALEQRVACSVLVLPCHNHHTGNINSKILISIEVAACRL